MKISLSVPFYPTEMLEKVEVTIINLLEMLPELEHIKMNEYILLTAEDLPVESLQKFFKNIRRDRVVDTVRNCAIVEPNRSIIFILHKQALFVERIAVITKDASSPLGNIELKIQTPFPEKVLDWLAPKTVEGEIIHPQPFKAVHSLS